MIYSYLGTEDWIYTLYINENMGPSKSSALHET